MTFRSERGLASADPDMMARLLMIKGIINSFMLILPLSLRSARGHSFS